VNVVDSIVFFLQELLDVFLKCLQLFDGHRVAAERALRFVFDRFNDAVCMEVVLDVAWKWRDLRVGRELGHADATLVVGLELFCVVDVLGEAGK
jgi:hypothetical protein